MRADYITKCEVRFMGQDRTGQDRVGHTRHYTAHLARALVVASLRLTPGFSDSSIPIKWAMTLKVSF